VSPRAAGATQHELSRVGLLATLPGETLGRLAARMEREEIPAGAGVVSEGERGDRFYVVAGGEIEIALDSGPPRVEGPGSYFGEIALLRDVPRTATVRARTDVQLYALERDNFLAAVTGHAGSTQAADAVVRARLGVAAI
jgi:CRP-like cAMP-binding protein